MLFDPEEQKKAAAQAASNGQVVKKSFWDFTKESKIFERLLQLKRYVFMKQSKSKA
jgi:hypothetical protein